MGQSLGPEFANCAGQRDSGPKSTPTSFLKESLESCRDERGKVLLPDRFDLHSRWPLEDFIYLQEPLVPHKIVISEDGVVEVTPEGPTMQSSSSRARRQPDKGEVHEKSIPSFGDGSFIYSLAVDGSQQYMMAVKSQDTPQLLPVVRRFSSQQELVHQLHEFLRGGAETLNITIGQELLVAEYDRTALLAKLEENELSQSKRRVLNWVITSFAWMTKISYHFSPAPDILKKYVERLIEKKHEKKQIVQDMKQSGLPKEAIARFKKFANDEGADSMSVGELCLRIMVDQAPERKFFPIRLNEDSGSQDWSMQAQGICKSVELCIKDILKEFRTESQDLQKWGLHIGWEPLRVLTPQEALHEALRHQAVGHDVNFIRYALKAASLVGHEAGPGRAPASNRLSDEAQESILAAGKAKVDSMVERFEQGEITRECFEEQFADLCDTMVLMIGEHILPGKEAPAHRAMCYRQMADYQRYVYLYVPRRRAEEQHVGKAYSKAEEYAQQLPQRSLVGAATAVNHALYIAEVRRDPAQAAAVCRRVLEHGNTTPRPHHEATTGIVEKINPSQVFTWNLLQQNLAAFETRLVLLRVSFNEESWEAHQELHEGRGAGGCSRSFASGSCIAADTATPSSEGTSRWASMQASAVEKARSCFERLPGGPELHVGAGSPTARATKSCALDSAWLPAFRSKPAPPPAPPEPDSMLKGAEIGIGIVRGWLQSRPLQVRQGEDEDSDSEEEQKGSLRDLVQQVRWIMHVEGQERQHDDAEQDGLEPSATHSRERCQEGLAAVGNLVRLKQRLSKPSYDFVVGCVVRLSPSVLAAYHRGTSKLNWTTALEQGLRKWPALGSESSKSCETKSLKVHVPQELRRITESLDSEGIVKGKRQFSSGDANIVTLFPGDTLMLPEDQKSLGAYLKMFNHILKNPDQPLAKPLSLKFLPSVLLNDVKVLEDGSYTDFHTRFTGFGSGSQEIHPSKHFHSFDALIKEMRAIRKRVQSSGGVRLPPRRIRDLSARRNPIQAADRGCK